MLRPASIDATAKFEQARGIPLGGVGDDLGEEILKALRLRSRLRVIPSEYMGKERTSRMVDMKMELALERQKNVVCGEEASLIIRTPRAMAGC